MVSEGKSTIEIEYMKLNEIVRKSSEIKEDDEGLCKIKGFLIFLINNF